MGRRPFTAELRSRFSSIWLQRPDGRPSLRPRCGIDLAAVSRSRPLLILCQMDQGQLQIVIEHFNHPSRSWAAWQVRALASQGRLSATQNR